MSSLISPIWSVMLLSFGFGFLIAILIGLIFGRDNSHKYAGASFGIGFMTGVVFQNGLIPILLCSLAGIAGWLFYRIMFPTGPFGRI